MATVDLRSLRTPGADPRFAVTRRGPYWRPGDSIISEPFVALGETNTGHAAIRYGRSRDRAMEHIERWHSLHAQVLRGAPDGGGRVVVGAAVVDPQGVVVDSWGHVPTPGGAPRWTGLVRLLHPVPCARCGEPRWTGCWVAVDGSGCALCLPEVEVADPRVWPQDPADLTVAVKPRRSGKRKPVEPVGPVVPAGQATLL